MNPKKIMVINTHAPYGKATARESLDAVLAASAYDQDLSLLFLGDAVFQLLQQQDTAALEAKSLSTALPVLPLYDVTAIYAQQSALDARGLTRADLVLDVECLENHQITALMDSQDILLSF
ncbi:sulfurtransferase complex subunit TusC [Exilibacterium tricleocarpae]|uniref:Sulfurtransferase complex subunit TusC n=1 Tax=Exilibacterium tricleocarpae TaxID=2591008 RepID=A0A545T8D2_9GAMM|nr:sulfurtransferase complex subunit TusC [Exilibacterium tricleocarpae]TQV73459.1 sulfurtransferase complex subunit TusC [Exilibacterium tricleocarpae]